MRTIKQGLKMLNFRGSLTPSIRVKKTNDSYVSTQISNTLRVGDYLIELVLLTTEISGSYSYLLDIVIRNSFSRHTLYCSISSDTLGFMSAAGFNDLVSKVVAKEIEKDFRNRRI